MAAIYNWIRGVAGVLLLTAFLRELLPSPKYVPFFRSFMGVLLILMVVRPLLLLGGWEGMLTSLAASWEEVWNSDIQMPSSSEEWEAMQREFWESGLRSQAEEEIRQIAEEEGLEVISLRLAEDEDSTLTLFIRDQKARAEEEREHAVTKVREKIQKSFDFEQVMVEVAA